MKLWYATALLLATLVPVLGAPAWPKPGKARPSATTTQARRRPASRSDALQQEKAGRTEKAKFRRVTVTRMVHGRLVRVSRIVRPAAPVVPPHPDPERLAEIQKALADKGYFKGETNGTWDPDSVAALKQFQTDRNLPPDGKISALSLIGLGLGPRHDGNVSSAAQLKPEAPAAGQAEPARQSIPQ